MEATWTMFERDSCSFSHDPPLAKTDERGENPQKQTERNALQTQRANIPCRHKICKTKNPSCGFGWASSRVKTTRLRPDGYMEEHVSSDMLRNT